jgi:hypothetical protein
MMRRQPAVKLRPIRVNDAAPERVPYNLIPLIQSRATPDWRGMVHGHAR